MQSLFKNPFFSLEGGPSGLWTLSFAPFIQKSGQPSKIWLFWHQRISTNSFVPEIWPSRFFVKDRLTAVAAVSGGIGYSWWWHVLYKTAAHTSQNRDKTNLLREHLATWQPSSQPLVEHFPKMEQQHGQLVQLLILAQIPFLYCDQYRLLSKNCSEIIVWFFSNVWCK